jgi:hypothetical protein
MNDKELLDLLHRYREGECTPDEIALVESWFNHAADQAEPVSATTHYEAARKRIWNKLGIETEKGKVSYMLVLRYAASILLIVAISYSSFLYFKRKTPQTQIAKQDIQPGGYNAMLTLANGKSISLNTNNGSVATLPNGILVSNSTSNGVVSFQIKNSKAEGAKHDTNVNVGGSNLITTPRGGQYQLLLPDGTRVYLNAASRLQFPSSFAVLKQRNVILTGEAYFEVAKDPQKPFIVSTKGQQLTVLGTHFNVSAYPNELQKTTLAEGSVELLLHPSTTTGIRQLLKPNQQAQLLSSGFQVKEIDASEATAWKDGNFVFTQLSLRDALLQISRWYVVEVNIADIPDTNISGQFPRTFTLQQVLQGIQKGTGIKIQLKDGELKYIR